MPDTPELTPPMQPGVDHPQHSEELRRKVGEYVGGKVSDVTPLSDTADKYLEDQTGRFLEEVAHVAGQTNVLPDSNSSDIFGDLNETVRAYVPGGETDRTASSKGPAELKDKRQEKMAKVS